MDTQSIRDNVGKLSRFPLSWYGNQRLFPVVTVYRTGSQLSHKVTGTFWSNISHVLREEVVKWVIFCSKVTFKRLLNWIWPYFFGLTIYKSFVLSCHGGFSGGWGLCHCMHVMWGTKKGKDVMSPCSISLNSYLLQFSHWSNFCLLLILKHRSWFKNTRLHDHDLLNLMIEKVMGGLDLAIP